ncbi:MAG: DNA mismatch repair protein MutS [Desulfobacteraceae bacterium]|nr:MAG: DNA mismatch repair protein MutS [Desulfobacteraceae bacterium]
MDEGEPCAVTIPIDGILDLHQFVPSDVPNLLEDYLELCIEKGIYHVRVIHGKGTGALRKRVHALLARDQRVISFSTDQGPGGWGATSVELRPISGQKKGVQKGG